MTATALEQRDFIAGIFLRAGIWVSHADDTDLEEHSEEQEMAYMRKALARVGNNSKSEIVRQSATHALTLNLGALDDSEEALTADIRRVVEALQETPDDLLQFRKALMYVATSVARAYREELDYHGEDEFMLENLMSRIAGALNKDADFEEFKNINISPAEDSALTLLSEALRA